MKLTLKMKLREKTKWKREEIKKAMEMFKNAVNDWIAIAWENNRVDRGIHALGYKKLREKYPELYSNSLQEAMNWAIQTVKAERKTNPNKKPMFEEMLISYKNVDFKFENNGFIIPLNGKRVYVPVYVPKKYYKWIYNSKFGRLYFRDEVDGIYAYLSVHIEEKTQYEPKTWLGVDLGYYNLAVVGDIKGREIMRFDGDIVNEYKKKREKELARRQRRKIKEFEIKNGRYGHKYKNYSSYINHRISKEIVRKAKEMQAGIVIEHLKGLKEKERKRGKAIRKILHRWNYGDLIEKIKYKAKLEGVPVIEISPKNTSKTCSRCGYVHKKFKLERVFRCPNCGFEIDRDLNASINIARLGYEKYKRASLPALKGEVSSPQRW